MVDANKGKVEELDLDMSLDDIPDLPEFLTPPTGAYLVTQVKHERKEIGDDPYMGIMFKIDAVSEMTGDLDEGEKPPEVGQEFEMIYSLTNTFGQGNLKRYLVPIAAKTQTKSARETLEAADNMQFLLVIVRKYNKKQERNYSQIKSLEVATA